MLILFRASNDLLSILSWAPLILLYRSLTRFCFIVFSIAMLHDNFFAQIPQVYLVLTVSFWINHMNEGPHMRLKYKHFFGFVLKVPRLHKLKIQNFDSDWNPSSVINKTSVKHSIIYRVRGFRNVQFSAKKSMPAANRSNRWKSNLPLELTTNNGNRHSKNNAIAT